LRYFASFESVHRQIPKTVQVGPHLCHPIGIEAIDAAGPVTFVQDQNGFLHNLQVLGNGRTTDRNKIGEITYRGGSLRKELEDRSSSRVTQDSNRISVGLH